MSSPEEPPQTDPQRERLRRWVWIGGAAVGLWFIFDGLRGIWPDAATSTRVLIVAVVVVVLVVLGVAYVRRRDRTD